MSVLTAEEMQRRIDNLEAENRELRQQLKTDRFKGTVAPKVEPAKAECGEFDSRPVPPTSKQEPVAEVTAKMMLENEWRIWAYQKGQIMVGTKLYAHPPAAEVARLLVDAERYRWIRERLQIRWMETLNGEKRKGIDIRIGHSFYSKKDPSKGYLSATVFSEDCKEVDAAIDAALATHKEAT